MRIYIAGPLFSDMERSRNARIRNLLLASGFETYLPQEDAGTCYALIDKGLAKAEVRKALFEKDIEAVRNCDVIVCLLDGRVPDEGMCVELGMAFALGKLCIGLKTDSRAMDKNGDSNIMIDGCLSRICATEEELTAEMIALRSRGQDVETRK